MQIAAASPYYRPAPRLAPRPHFRPAPSLGAGETFQKVWRDFGINPLAMLRRATVEPPAAPGQALPEVVAGDRATLEDLRGELHGLLQELGQGQVLTETRLREFQSRFARVAESYGVDVSFQRGAPRVNWGKFPQLEVYDQGGPSALHEMVHAVQCTVGAVAGLSAQARSELVDRLGREPTPSEVRQQLASLNDNQRQQAFRQTVAPMENLAYARFEEGAFHASGMFGKKARDLGYYAARAGHNLDVFTTAYQEARAPALDSGLDARIYGRIGHVARTHGETALLLGAAGYGYHRLVGSAMAVHPLLGACALVPLGGLIYRVARG